MKPLLPAYIAQVPAMPYIGMTRYGPSHLRLPRVMNHQRGIENNVISMSFDTSDFLLPIDSDDLPHCA